MSVKALETEEKENISEKVLIIKSNRSLLISKKRICELFRIDNMFENMPKRYMILKDILIYGGVKLNENYYNHKLKNVKEEIIIIFDAHVRIQFLTWIVKNNPGKRIILWLWNTMEEIGSHIPLKKVPTEIEIWSYSPYDCKKYNLKHNTTFYPYKLANNSVTLTYDVCFIGKDKGRLNEIMEIKNKLQENGLTTYFHISPTHFYELRRNSVYKKAIPYSEVDKIISESNCILDCEVTKNAGITIRPLEALYKRKKLITNNKNILYEDFYSSNNIFIWGHDDISALKYFVRSPYVELPEEIYKKYTMEAWVTRFLNGVSDEHIVCGNSDI